MLNFFWGVIELVEIITIGYAAYGRHPHAFFEELDKLNADLVVDVRRDPHHAFLGVFIYSSLKKRVKNYIWVQALGNAHKKLPPKYIDEEWGFNFLTSLIRKRDAKKVVLLCAEKDENHCHRKYVKDELTKRLSS